MIRGDHRRVTQWEHVLEHRFIRPRGARALPARLETAAERFALTFGTLQPLVNQVALAATLLQLGAETPASRKASDQITHEQREPAHLKAIIAPL
jgi:hypothetical protein